jgi:hypothetical protein
MSTPLKMIPAYQLVLTFASLAIVLVASWVNINSRITALEISQKSDEDFKLEMRAYFRELSDGQLKIFVELQNKKNRE